MGKRHRFDEVFKDLFQTGRPSLVERWSGGQAAVESLSVELPVIRRIGEAAPGQVRRWVAKVLTATSLEGVVGRRK